MSVEVMVQNEMGGYPPSRGPPFETDRSSHIQHKKIRNRKKIRVRTKLVDRGMHFRKKRKTTSTTFCKVHKRMLCNNCVKLFIKLMHIGLKGQCHEKSCSTEALG